MSASMPPEPIPIRQPSDAGPPPWQEPVRGGYPEPEIFQQAPSVMLRAMVAGTAPQPPISRLTGMRLIECGMGTTSFSMPLSDWLCTSQGAISIGPLTIPADAAMACAIQTELPPATPLTTAELSLRLLRPAPAGGSITARGRVIDVRRTIALAEVTVTDQDERLIAHGSSLCVLHPEPGPASARGEAPEPSPARETSHGPSRRHSDATTTRPVAATGDRRGPPPGRVGADDRPGGAPRAAQPTSSRRRRSSI